MVSITSSSVSPNPSMMEDLVYTPHSFAALSTSSDCIYPARESLTRLCNNTGDGQEHMGICMIKPRDFAASASRLHVQYSVCEHVTCSRSTVSMLWAYTSSPERARCLTAPRSPRKSGVKHSTRVSGLQMGNMQVAPLAEEPNQHYVPT